MVDVRRRAGSDRQRQKLAGLTDSCRRSDATAWPPDANRIDGARHPPNFAAAA
jgi:hypothetical protein